MISESLWRPFAAGVRYFSPTLQLTQETWLEWLACNYLTKHWRRHSWTRQRDSVSTVPAVRLPNAHWMKQFRSQVERERHTQPWPLFTTVLTSFCTKCAKFPLNSNNSKNVCSSSTILSLYQALCSKWWYGLCYSRISLHTTRLCTDRLHQTLRRQHCQRSQPTWLPADVFR